uniref:Ig-like domain-containing protein n=1 Tax=Maylandia zebra TaxID=106582 RepID=A0A3P9C510_9CICH
VQSTSSPPTVFPLIPCGSESSTALKDFIQYPAVQNGNVYTGVSQIRVRRQDWDTQQNFQCGVNHTVGNGQANITKPLVFEQNPTLKVISSPDEDGTYTASCFTKEFAPKKHDIKWLKIGADVTSKKRSDHYMKMCGILLYFYSGILITVVSPFLATSTAPTVFPLVPCGTESGDMVTLGCLATGFNPPAVTFSWNKGSTALTDFIQYPAVQKGDVYTGVSQVRVRKQDWNPQQNFQCVVNHAAGNAQADIRPTRKPYLFDTITFVHLDLLIGDYLEFHHPGLSGDDNIASVAIVFILLFLITLLLIFGTTVIKVIRN